VKLGCTVRGTTPHRPLYFLADLLKMLPTIPLKRMATPAAAKSYIWFGISVSVCSFLTLSADRKLFGWTEEPEKMV
jgi:hypothetical protein